jgi:tRNA modification GTPase
MLNGAALHLSSVLTDQQDTIVAISTPPGRGGIGIVRLSGLEARTIAEPMLRLRHPLAPAQARFAEVLDTSTGVKLDEAVVTYFPAPNSYTGEDIVEIAAHGAPVVLEAIVRQTLSLGARLAEPGEFTRRAFLNGRLDLTQAEAVHDLIAAQTLHQARIAAEQLDGALSRRIQPAKQELVNLIAALEAGIDFAEDDIDVMPADAIRSRIAAVHTQLSQLAASFAYGRVVRDGLTLALCGRPNVGKSSLFNQLVQRERAIVTAQPGTTRDLVSERISLDGIPLELVDTAGLRTADTEAEAIGIRKTREALAEAEIVLLVFDATQPANDEDRRLLDLVAERNGIVAVNKCDLVQNGSQRAAPTDAILTSALTGEGIHELRERILARIHHGATNEVGMITNLRQQQAITSAIAALETALEAVKLKTPHEMLLLDLYSALRALDSLTGATTADDVLNLIFSQFCIGK